ncbi:hypothetical protein E2C01_029032 [Portunus trituberculatus]|uniref:Uncharacterized protein n=1 Tax=Portunus trituberculatus TaxID=210409 RepID=A0A5B7EQW2_PORTR|nr:hypothetical protein [Portunus trituberculatus]
MCDGGGPQRALPLAADPLDGAVGPEGFHPHPATPAGHAAPSVPDGSTPDPS